MGNNYYIDESNGDDDYAFQNIDSFPHIGKFTTTEYGATFIFYHSRQYQLERLEQMNSNEMVIDEFGQRTIVRDFLNKIRFLPYLQHDFEFS